MILLSISITSILLALLWLAIIVGIIYIVFWVLTKLGITVPANIANVIWVILVLLGLIFIVDHFFFGGGGGLNITR